MSMSITQKSEFYNPAKLKAFQHPMLFSIGRERFKMQYLDDTLARAEAFLNGKWWYGYGFKASNNPPTMYTVNQLASMYPSVYTADYIAKVKSYIDKDYSLIDCSGLVCNALAIPDIGSYQLGLLPNTHSDNMYTYQSTAQEGDILWKSGHVALAISPAHCIEAKGINYGVRKSLISEQGFTKIIRPTYLYYKNLGWNKDNNGWWYAYGRMKGEYYWNCTAWIDDKLYAFDKEGYLVYNPTVTTDANGAIKTISGERSVEVD